VTHARWQDGDLLLACHLQPGASRSELAGMHGDRLKIRIKAPPIEGRANDELRRFLAAACDVAQRDVVIEQGELGRQKLVRIRAPRQVPAGLGIGSS
jgi:uncharacterized protein (TIGR00251 family)